MSNYCRKCGAELPNEMIAFCTKCGANQREIKNEQNPQNTSVLQSEKPVGVGEWVGWILLCSLLPIIGAIIMLCAANKESIKNYAKANLIFSVIGVVFVFVILIIIFAVIGVSFIGRSAWYF